MIGDQKFKRVVQEAIRVLGDSKLNLVVAMYDKIKKPRQAIKILTKLQLNELRRLKQCRS
jgi:hypothetical protein